MKAVTVSQLNKYVGRLFSTDPILSQVAVKGEISYIKYHGSGHVYMTISDENSRLNCFMPAPIVIKQKEIFKEGDQVEITGSIRVYERGGTYSLNVRIIEKEGRGRLYENFLEVKNRLDKEGLFDPSKKKSLPEFPGHVGIITSETGAGARDIIKIIKTRNNFTDVTLFPATVQGPKAAEELIEALEFVDRNFSDKIDVLIIGRGGGAPEDLAAFNDENLARAVYSCKIPIISAVGHEIDFSITDFTADKRAETPTAAAQIAVPDIRELKRDLTEGMQRLHAAVSNKVMYEELSCTGIKKELENSVKAAIKEKEEQAERCRLILRENNYLSVLGNGYSIITGKNGKKITSHDDIENGETYSIYLEDGKRSYRLNRE